MTQKGSRDRHHPPHRPPRRHQPSRTKHSRHAGSLDPVQGVHPSGQHRRAGRRVRFGVAFKTVVDAFAGDGKDNPGILGSLIGVVFGGERPNFGERGVTVNGSFVPVGGLVMALLNFAVVAVVLFVVIKAYNRIRPPADETTEAPTELDLLTAIRDELRRSNDVTDSPV